MTPLVATDPPPLETSGVALVPLIERMATDPRVGVDQLERLLGMYERELARQGKAAFDAAVSEAKGDIPPIFKNRKVDYTSAKGRTAYRHEDFAEIARTIDPILVRHGLSYRHRATQSGPRLSVTCILSHRGGYAEETTLEAANDESGSKNPIQSIGSAATYLQRYTLKLALGLSASDDDDGKATQHAPAIDADQLALIEQQLRDTSSDTPAFLKRIRADSIETMTIEQFKTGIALLADKRRKMEAAPQ